MVSTLLGSIHNSTDSWWIDNGASKHMAGFRKALVDYKDKKFNVKVEMGDDNTYSIREVSSSSFRLDSYMFKHIGEILYVPVLKEESYFTGSSIGKRVHYSLLR